MEEEKTQSLGEYFKNEREKRGITLKEIEGKTKISAQILRFLEDDRVDLLPPRAFIRGFLQVIAKEFDMDEMALLHHMEQTLGEPEQSLANTTKKRKKGLWWKVAILLAIVLFFALFIRFCNSGDIKGHASTNVYPTTGYKGNVGCPNISCYPIPGISV